MTLEQQLFSWEAWDEFENGVLAFYDVVLKVDIVNRFKAGHKFNRAVFDMQKSRITFFDKSLDDADSDVDGDVGYAFELNITIGQAIVV